MRIQNNITGFNAYRNVNMTQQKLQNSMEKLASGYRINKAADDAAGLVTSESLRAKIFGLRMAARNTNDAISVAQTAEGSLDEIGNILRRMRDLAVQSANVGGNSDAALNANQAEYDQLLSELDRIFVSSKYGDKTLFNNTTPALFTFQVGADAADLITFQIGTANVGGTNLGINTIDIGAGGSPASAILLLDTAIERITSLRGEIGAFQNRLESTVRNLSTQTENLQAAESRIRDADMALETVDFTKYQILQQAGVAMLSQANTSTQSVLSLLG